MKENALSTNEHDEAYDESSLLLKQSSASSYQSSSYNNNHHHDNDEQACLQKGKQHGIYGFNIVGGGRLGKFVNLYKSEQSRRVRRWLAFIVGCFVMTASGTPYSFSSISPSLKKTFLLSQSEVNLIGTSANLGSNFSFIFSFANDIFGSRVSSLLAGACLFFSYFAMSLVVTGNLPFMDPYLTFCFLMFLMGSACGGGFISSISTSMKNFPERNRGLVSKLFLEQISKNGNLVGVLSSCYGISSAIYSGAYLYVFQQNLEIYLIFCAILGGVVIMILGPIFLDSNAGSNMDGNNSTQKDIQKDTSLSINDNDTNIESIIPNMDEIDENSIEFKITNLKSKLESNQIPNINPFKMLLSLDFYLSFLITFLFVGSGIVVINNLGSIVQSYGGKNGEQNNMVIVFSCCNCFGRILFGLLSDKFFNPKRHLTRITFIGITIIMMTLGQYLFAIIPLQAFYPLVVFIGICYGGFFALNPSFISERFGSKYYGLNSTIQAISSSLGSYAFSTGLAGYLYQVNISEPRELTCHGVKCYQLTFYILTGCNCLAFVLTLILQWRTMWLYRLLKSRRDWSIELTRLLSNHE